MLKKYIYFIVPLTLLLSGCDTNKSSTNESPACREAKAEYSFCSSNCLLNTPGGFIAAFSKCGNTCSSQTFKMRSVCG